MSDDCGGGDTSVGCDTSAADTGGAGADTGGCSNVNSTANEHTNNDYTGTGTSVSAFDSAVGPTNSVEFANSAFHHDDSTQANNHHSSTGVPIDDVSSHGKYNVGWSESIWNNDPTDNIPTGGNRRNHCDYTGSDFYSRDQGTSCWEITKSKWVILVIAAGVCLVVYICVLLANGLMLHTYDTILIHWDSAK